MAPLAWETVESAYPTLSVAAKIMDLPVEKVHVIFARGSACCGLNGADAVSFDAAVLSQEFGKPVRLQYSWQDEMIWENPGTAMVVKHRAGPNADGSIMAWDREGWAADHGARDTTSRAT